jgi:hypothetical protein
VISLYVFAVWFFEAHLQVRTAGLGCRAGLQDWAAGLGCQAGLDWTGLDCRALLPCFAVLFNFVQRMMQSNQIIASQFSFKLGWTGQDFQNDLS